MKFFGGMEAAGAEVINTSTAGALPIAMGDDTGNVGAIVPEAQASGHAGGTSPTVSDLVLHGYLYSSKTVKVSWQIIRDAATNIEAYVGGLLGQRLARIQNTHFTATGTGVGQPKALMLSVSTGRQSATGNTTSVPFDDILRLIHSLNVAYRESRLPSVGWMLHDNSILALRLAKDGNGRYLWPELGSVQVGQPGVLEGYRYTVNNDMPVMAASAKWATFGDHSYYKIRRIGGITITRLNELYAESGQVGFLAFQSADGGFANPGIDPVVCLQNSGS
jgi:HK97 family phage major capsid protein